MLGMNCASKMILDVEKIHLNLTFTEYGNSCRNDGQKLFRKSLYNYNLHTCVEF